MENRISPQQNTIIYTTHQARVGELDCAYRQASAAKGRMGKASSNKPQPDRCFLPSLGLAYLYDVRTCERVCTI